MQVRGRDVLSPALRPAGQSVAAGVDQISVVASAAGAMRIAAEAVARRLRRRIRLELIDDLRRRPQKRRRSDTRPFRRDR